MLIVALLGELLSTLGAETFQETSSSFSLFENIQPLASMDPYNIIKEEKEKNKSTKGYLQDLEPNDPLAQPRIHPIYNGLKGEFTLTTFEPITINPNIEMRDDDWKETHVKINTFESSPHRHYRVFQELE